MVRVSLSFLLLLALAVGLSGQCEAGPIFVATLDGSQENPPVSSGASGFAFLSLNDAQTRLEMHITLFGLDLDGMQTADPNDDVTRLHIHRGPVGVNGPIVFGLIAPDNDLNGDLVINPAAGTLFSAWDLNEGNGTTLAAELANLLNGGLYLNVHTPQFPGGAIRGQIIEAVPEPGSVLVWVSTFLGLAVVAWRRKNRSATIAV